VDGLIKGFKCCEGLMGEMAAFQLTPGDLDVVEFGGILGQPLDFEPVGAGCERRACGLADQGCSVL
jgi:hypothetical protein